MVFFLWILSLLVMGGCGFVFGWAAHAFLVGEAKAVVPVPVFKVAETPAPAKVVAIVPRVSPTVEHVSVKFMDCHERSLQDEGLVDARARRPTMWHQNGKKYMASKQDADGTWIYREVRH